MIGAPTPNATFTKLLPSDTNTVVTPERGLKMEIFRSSSQSNADQCRCELIVVVSRFFLKPI